MAERFTWRATGQPAGTVTYRRIVARFGDGYRQVVGDGINNRVQSWPVQIQGDRAEIMAAMEFLDRHSGVRSFLWTPPVGEEGYYEVSSFSLTPVGGTVYTLSATFEQVFRP
ncbi:phage tail protein [Achromobacter xylosoxidans]|uniref:phage tail protein n=1 Tax=Alcaligenes xylosoxydans xylosoxydans TaxID=85698 RepID=UPI001F13C79E|nr:phage tail protein [Achromobacter xylosoxidans]